MLIQSWARLGDRDILSLAQKRALFFRATFVPSLLPALAPSRSAAERQTFADRLTEGLQRRLLDHPAPIDQLVGTIVLAKEAGAGEAGSRPARGDAHVSQ